MPPKKKNEIDVCTEEPQDVERAHTTQKINTSRGRGRGKKTWLKTLLDIPVELFDKVCRHLEPLDLLHLARTNKTFRNYLMDQQRKSLWKCARNNFEDLPDCPAYLAEPAYANLLFCTHCHHCLTRNVHNVLLRFSTRFCNACKGKLFVDQHRDTMCLYQTDYFFKIRVGKYGQYIYKPDLEESNKVFANLAKDSPEYDAAMTARRQLNSEIRQFSIICQKWFDAQKVAKANDIEKIKKTRLEDIITQLTALGWGEELEDEGSIGRCLLLRADPRVQQAKPLNQRVWNSMQPALVKAMEEARKRRLEKLRRQGVTDRMRVLDAAVRDFRWTLAGMSDAAYLPTLVDFAYMEPFNRLLDPDLSPESDILERADSEELWDQLEYSTNSWRLMVKEQLAAVVKKEISGPDDDVDLLEIACLVFKCNFCCKEGIEYPEVTAHTCLYRETASVDRGDILAYQIATFSANTARLPWSCSNLTVDLFLMRCRWDVIFACNLPDPWRVSRLSMETLDPRLYCALCSEDTDMRVLDWRAMAQSRNRSIDHECVEGLKQVPPRLEEAIKARESAGCDMKRGKVLEYKCSRCSPWIKYPGSFWESVAVSGLTLHLQTEHHLKNASIATPNVYVCPNSRLTTPRTTIVMARGPSYDIAGLRATFDEASCIEMDANCSLLLYDFDD